jgi:hypothetical protein
MGERASGRKVQMERGAKVVNNPMKGLRVKLKDNALISHVRCT